MVARISYLQFESITETIIGTSPLDWRTPLALAGQMPFAFGWQLAKVAYRDGSVPSGAR